MASQIRRDSSRRTFLKQTVLTAALAAAARPSTIEASASPQASSTAPVPWYRRAWLWGQTNITEKDPIRYDIAWWREEWKRTEVQAVIVNAGGIVAYYPSRFPLHHRAEFLGDRDLFGELTAAAHADGIFVMARMDSNRTAEDFFQAHPDWFARDRNGRPYRAADKYITCINSPYYDEYLPDVMREIIDRSHPDGFTDNGWAGLGRGSICYCDNCVRRFRARTGLALPAAADWDDEAYRQWIQWNYARRTELWDFNNRVTRDAGGPDCIWSGMNSGSVTSEAQSFRDLKAICSRAAILMLDHQRRDDSTGFQQNGDTGKLVHGVLGWDKIAPESMAMYESGPGYYRVASKPAAEARMWMIEGIAGGIQPWWHFVGAYQEDRRMLTTPTPVMRWWHDHRDVLIDRTPVATIGLIWSQQNTDFFGRSDPGSLVDAPYTGFMHALVRARLPYLPVHIDDVNGIASRLRTLILPNIGAISDAQADALRTFVRAGGSLVVTGHSSLFTEWGDPRPDFALADLIGCHWQGEPPRARPAGRQGGGPAGAFAPPPSGHTYLRLAPSLAANADGPKAGDEPPVTAARHEVLRGFEDTDILAFGGTLTPLTVNADAIVPLTFIPPFPTYPPETAWMREPRTDIPGLVLTEHGAGRVAYFAADIDRRYALEHLPDHARLLANVIRWAAHGGLPLTVDGAGLVDCHLYEQPGRLILHLVNLTSEATWRAPLDELIKVGPFDVAVRLAAGMKPRTARLLVSDTNVPIQIAGGTASFRVEFLLDHEVVLIE
jgi:hypothetical protein